MQVVIILLVANRTNRIPIPTYKEHMKTFVLGTYEN